MSQMVSGREEFYLPFSLQFMLMTFCSLFKTSGSAVSGSLTLLEFSVMLTTWHFLHHRLQHFDQCSISARFLQSHVVLNLIQQRTNLFILVDVSVLFVLIAFNFVIHLSHTLSMILVMRMTLLLGLVT